MTARPDGAAGDASADVESAGLGLATCYAAGDAASSPAGDAASHAAGDAASYDRRPAMS